MSNPMAVPRRVVIPTSEQIKKIPILLKKHFGEQFADFWKFGLQTGFRTEEILNLRFAQFSYEQLDRNPENRLFTCEIESRRTRSKVRKQVLSPSAEKIIRNIENKHPNSKFVFQSYRSRGVSNKRPQPLSRQAISHAFKEVGEILGIKLTPVTMRQLALNRVCADVKPIQYWRALDDSTR
ncbi:tyrosine-type recombinase/integrase [Vibrio parahaemolyticus]|uniref:tyrosine-type recombinase/integrase n=1 Tax=Vibrio parahaemolyticus TaxID=670 RepID=UPI00112112E3|nr:tyrosine-type recombinase/integrase [Vibrio parahaemolyticus]TOI00535.1 hypothetical protein CGI70_06400 [Vibrio parahaemolyticus]TOJ59720.1 hypothetical protein CGI35_19750 [Vibrio parahaemolyticus]TOK14738.1 hypothetical protein CGI28_10985 [Vibrio parahaemolyticus]